MQNNYSTAYLPQDIPEASKKLQKWRRSQRLSSGGKLAEHINKHIRAAFEGKSIPSGTLIYQPDVSKAERGLQGPFEKVTATLYTYCGVETGYFGLLEPVSPQERITAVREEASSFISKLQSDLTAAQKTAMDALEKVIKLQDENKSLRIENASLKEKLTQISGKS